MTEDKQTTTAEKLNATGERMQDLGKNITCGCLSVVILVIIGFVLYSLITG